MDAAEIPETPLVCCAQCVTVEVAVWVTVVVEVVSSVTVCNGVVFSVFVKVRVAISVVVKVLATGVTVAVAVRVEAGIELVRVTVEYLVVVLHAVTVLGFGLGHACSQAGQKR